MAEKKNFVQWQLTAKTQKIFILIFGLECTREKNLWTPLISTDIEQT